MAVSPHPNPLSASADLLALAGLALDTAGQLESRRRLAYQPRGQTLHRFLEQVRELERALGTLLARAGAEAEAEVHNSAARLREALLAIRPDPSRPLWELYLPTVTGEKAKAYREAADHWHKTVSNCRAGTHLGSEGPEPEQPASDAQARPSPRACGGTAAAPTASIPAETCCFQLRGASWHLRYGKEEGIYPDSKGMQYIARLLAQPGQPLGALALARGGGLGPGSARTAKDVLEATELLDGAAPTTRASQQYVLDPDAAAAYRQQLTDYNRDIEKAAKDGNTVQADLLHKEKEELLRELRRATGLGGRSRTLGPAAAEDKAKDAVRKRLKAAYDKMTHARPPLPALVRHLKASIRAEGSAYVYRAGDPAPDWRIAF